MAPTRRAGGAKPATGAAAAPGDPRILKKYPNRRLYDTAASSYITLADVKAMVLSGEHFEVRDAKTGEDLTRSILLQIILEEETGGVPMFSTPMLAQIIRFYGHAMQGMMGSYLEKNLQTFTDIQARLAEQSQGPLRPAGADARDVDAVPQRPGAGGAEPDGQLPRAVAQHVRADAGADGQAGRGAVPGPAGLHAAEDARVRRRTDRGNRPQIDAGPTPRTPASRAEDRLRLARLPQGADRFRADPDAAARRGLRHLARPSPAPTW